MLQETEDNSDCSEKYKNEFYFLWKLNNINHYIYNNSLSDNIIESQEFSVGKMKLVLYMERTLSKNHSMFLKCINVSTGKFSLQGQLWFSNKYGKQLGYTHIFTHTFNQIYTSAQITDAMTKHKKFGDGNVIIICKGYCGEISNLQEIETSPYYLTTEFSEKFGNQKFSDIAFSVCGKEFYAHKFLLAARSSVFQKMFKDEKKENIILINDVAPEVFEEILRFIYTGNVASEKISKELYECANNFGLARLKAICARQLCYTVSIKNVCDLLILADKYKEQNLKTKSINFINMNVKEVIKKKNWKLIKNSTDLLKEINKAILLEYTFWKEISPTVKNQSSNFIVDSYFASTEINTKDSDKKFIIENYKSCIVTKRQKYTITDIMISNKFEVPDCDLRSDLTLLLKNPKFSDFTLVVSGKELQVHKLILSARSPVFQAMFEHDMEENRNSKVVIPDIKHEVFEEMLKYIYTGSISNRNEIAIELFCAADKYALEELQIICIKNLSNNLSINNVSETLIFAETFNLKELKISALEYIMKNLSEVMNTDNWKSILDTHPMLVWEICEAIVTE